MLHPASHRAFIVPVTNGPRYLAVLPDAAMHKLRPQVSAARVRPVWHPGLVLVHAAMRHALMEKVRLPLARSFACEAAALIHAPTSLSRSRVAEASGGLYSHLDMETVHDALLQVEGQVDGAMKYAGAAADHCFASTYRPHQRVGSALLMSGQTNDPEQLMRLRFRDKTGTLDGQGIIELLQFILRTRLKVTNSIIKDEWQIDGEHLIRAIHEASPPSTSISRFDDEIRYLPMAPTKMNKELVRTHLQLMSRFKASLDGSPRPNNRFMKHWIPFSIQDPLVLHVVLCSTASFLNETGRVPKMMLLVHRATATRMLNEHISNAQVCTDDSAMLAVAQSILTSWYWGGTEELHAHMAGFKRMIELRGSMQNLGMEGFTSKIALINDFVIALVHETEPLLFGVPGFVFDDPLRLPLQVNFNSPLLFECPPFLSPASPMLLHAYTARILDEVRTLSKLVVDLPVHPTRQQLESVYRTVNAALSVIECVPEDVTLVIKEKNEAAAAEAEYGSAGLKRKRQASEAPTARKAWTTESAVRATAASERPDLVHRCVRKTARIYCLAILERIPTSSACKESDFAQIWEWAWGAGLDRWAALSGIFVWMMIAILGSSLSTIHSRMAKTMMVTGFMYLGTENWHVAADIADAGLRIQRWLRGGRSALDDGTVSAAWGGERVIEKHGFLFKDAMPDIVQMCDEGEQGPEGED
ncbi:hypothetical protein RJ55_04819 [Drechmeria coniospora]|nr:hypothetical protein RJ55_04819 [Drechmeria coniospora]